MLVGKLFDWLLDIAIQAPHHSPFFLRSCLDSPILESWPVGATKSISTRRPSLDSCGDASSGQRNDSIARHLPVSSSFAG